MSRGPEQALREIFRFRDATQPQRPLAEPLDYELLRSYLRSGEAVAHSFLGPFAFSALGQNTGREPTTLQVFAGRARYFVHERLDREKHVTAGHTPDIAYRRAQLIFDGMNVLIGDAVVMIGTTQCIAVKTIFIKKNIVPRRRPGADDTMLPSRDGVFRGEPTSQLLIGRGAKTIIRGIFFSR